ncbi:MAG: carboxymuconolactone decarboxylase family protein [Pseudomonadota bacterium]
MADEVSSPADSRAERMGPVSPDSYDEAQQQAAAAFHALRGVPLFGPFQRLIRSPELLTHVQSLGEYLRYRSVLGPRLVEFAILVTAREWDQEYEWSLHAPLALRHGVPRDVIDALNRGQQPDLQADEAACRDVSLELHRTHLVAPATYARAMSLLGEQRMVELTAVSGYYALLAMQLNMMQTPPVATDIPLIPRSQMQKARSGAA